MRTVYYLNKHSKFVKINKKNRLSVPTLQDLQTSTNTECLLLCAITLQTLGFFVMYTT